MTIQHGTNHLNQDIPVMPSVVVRTKVAQHLDKIRRFKVTLVSAPPGYGKTTVVAHYASQSDMRWVWHSLEELDTDVRSLHHNATKALEFVAPGISDIAIDSDSPFDSASTVTNFLQESVSEPFAYVIDDVHLLAGYTQAERWLSLLVEQLPSRCHLVLISRTIPDIPLVELIAKGDVLAIGQEVLKFTEEDIPALYEQSGESIAIQTLQSCVEQLEGWPAGVLISIQPLPESLELSALKGQKGPEALFGAMANITLERQPPVLRDFLLAASIPAKLTPEFISKVLGYGDGYTFITDVLNRNLFVHRISGGIVFHRLFKDFLQDRLKQADEERYCELHRKAGDWFSAEFNYDYAFHHYLEANDFESALKLVDRLHSVLFSQGNVELLLRWQRILGDQAQKIPRFIFTCAMIHTDRYMFEQAESELRLVGQVAQDEHDPILFADVELQQALILLRRDRLGEAIQQTEQVIAGVNLSEFALARAKHLLAQANFEIGNTSQAIEILEELSILYESGKDAYAYAAVLQDLERAYSRRGDLNRANECLQQVILLQRKLNSPSALALSLNNLGFHYHQRGLFNEAIETFEEGIQIVTKNPNPRARSYLLWSYGDLLRDLSDFQRASKMYDSAYELASSAEPRLAFSISLSISTLYRWRGDYAVAERIASSAVKAYGKIENDPNILFAKALVIIAEAHAHSDSTNSLYELERILSKLNQTDLHVETKLVAIFCCMVGLLQDDLSIARKYLDQSIGLIAPDFGIYAIAAEAKHFVRLRKLISLHPQYQVVQDALVKLKSLSKDDADAELKARQKSAGLQSTYGLRIFTLGRQLIERDGISILPADWVASRARELFFYLLFEGATDRANISLMMWPDASPGSVRSNFHTTLYRIRQAVGDNSVVFLDGKYAINPHIDIWCDVFVMQENLHRASILSPRDVLADELYQSAITLYQGEFLVEFDAEWTLMWRSKLEDLYIQALIGAGQCAVSRGDYKQGLDIYQRAKQVDPFREEIYRAIFQCLANMGERHRLLTQFAEMRDFFEQELGVLPSQQTSDFVIRLTSSS